MDRNERSGEAIRQFIQTDRLHKSLFDSVMARQGLHRNQHWAMLYLDKNGASSSQKQIADHLGISAAAVAVMMKRLEEMGYVKRCVSENDNRNHTISLTEKGKSLLLQTRRIFQEIDIRMLEGLTDEELTIFIGCHKKIRENLQAVRLEGGDESEMV